MKKGSKIGVIFIPQKGSKRGQKGSKMGFWRYMGNPSTRRKTVGYTWGVQKGVISA
jgi:hypothetical protein